MTPVLAVRGLRVRYTEAWALEVDALDVRAGEVLAVMGPNGSGKSTLLRALGLLERPQAGEVRFHDAAIDAARALAARRRMATVFQEPLLADMTVAANVALGLRFRSVNGAAAAARVDRWLERFGIGGLRERRARTLSGGEAQRVALARALVLEPEVLLLDEPFGGLDQPTRDGLVPLLGAILRADRVTTVLVTHERGEAQALADRVAVLIGGRLHQVADTACVFYAPASEEVARFVGVETIVTGRVTACDGGVAVVEVAGRAIEVAADAAAGDTVRLAIRPEDVTLMPPADRPVHTSARNVLSGRITGITPVTHGARVVVDCGFPLAVVVTARSVRDLGLADGVQICAVFKASAPHLIPYPVRLDTPRAPGL